MIVCSGIPGNECNSIPTPIYEFEQYHECIIYGYDLEKRLQSEDRAHRIGQKKSVTYVDLIAPKTVDEKIRKALRKKINIATQVMGEELRDWI